MSTVCWYPAGFLPSHFHFTKLPGRTVKPENAPVDNLVNKIQPRFIEVPSAAAIKNSGLPVWLKSHWRIEKSRYRQAQETAQMKTNAIMHKAQNAPRLLTDSGLIIKSCPAYQSNSSTIIKNCAGFRSHFPVFRARFVDPRPLCR